MVSVERQVDDLFGELLDDLKVQVASDPQYLTKHAKPHSLNKLIISRKGKILTSGEHLRNLDNETVSDHIENQIASARISARLASKANKAEFAVHRGENENNFNNKVIKKEPTFESDPSIIGDGTQIETIECMPEIDATDFNNEDDDQQLQEWASTSTSGNAPGYTNYNQLDFEDSADEANAYLEEELNGSNDNEEYDNEEVDEEYMENASMVSGNNSAEDNNLSKLLLQHKNLLLGSPSQPNRQQYICSTRRCGKIFSTRVELEEHKLAEQLEHRLLMAKMKEEENLKSVRPRGPYKKRLKSTEMRADNDDIKQEIYTCKYRGCGRTFRHIAEMNIHLRVHTRAKPYICKWPKCNYQARQLGAIYTHIRLRHFRLPKSQKEQQQLGITDERSPKEWMEVRRELL